MFIYMLNTTSGFTVKGGKCIDVPKKVVTQLGTMGFRSLDNRYSRLDTVEAIASEMMDKQKNKVGYAIYSGTINNPRLVTKYITKSYRELEIDLENA